VIDAAAYHRDDVADVPTLSSSIAKLLCTASPAHARAAHPKLNPNYETSEESKFDLGTAVHSLILEGIDCAHVVHAANWTTNAAKEERAWARENGKTPLLVKEWDRARQMVAAAETQLDAYNLSPRPFTDGRPEVPLVWETDGVACRALIDWLHDDAVAVADYKSTSASAHPAAWPKTAMGIGAELQVAMHSAGVEAVYGRRPVWLYIVQETYPPYALQVIEPDESWMTIGQSKLEHALDIWRRCLAADDWPAYPAQVARVAMPGYAEARWSELLEAEIAA
jgi:PDDEXK-like domain of unknown function (DUF3799)